MPWAERKDDWRSRPKPVKPSASATKSSSHFFCRGSGKIRKSKIRMAQPNSASITAGMMVK